MNKTDIIRKLTSRKLWVTIVGIVVGIAAAFGITENEYAQVVGLIGSIVSGVAYVMGEAKIDAAGAVPINIQISEETGEGDGREV